MRGIRLGRIILEINTVVPMGPFIKPGKTFGTAGACRVSVAVVAEPTKLELAKVSPDSKPRAASRYQAW